MSLRVAQADRLAVIDALAASGAAVVRRTRPHRRVAVLRGYAPSAAALLVQRLAVGSTTEYWAAVLR